MKCTLTKGAYDNWFCITDADHWMQRINGADVEGDREEMLAIAVAIETRQSVSFKRCAVRHLAHVGGFALSSPRNSVTATCISPTEADDLAREIRRVLAETPIDEPSTDYDGCEETP